MLEEVIREKLQNIKVLEEDGMCSMEQVKPEKQSYVLSKLLPKGNIPTVTEGPPSVEDIKRGYQFFNAMVYCPDAWTLKVFRFVNQMLSSVSLRTIIQTSVNLLQSGTITDERSLALAKQFYNILASTLNLQYGKVLVATSTKADLQAVLTNGWPLFLNFTDLVAKCLQDSHCDGIQDIIQNLGTQFTKLSFINPLFRRLQQCLTRAFVPPSSPDSRRPRQSSPICVCSLLLIPGEQQPSWTGKTGAW